MNTYLALGDSYTIGESVPLHDNFPYQTVGMLRKKGLQVSDPMIVAVTGWTTDELAAAIRERNVQGHYSFVSLLIGVNNQYRGRDLENYKKEFTQLLDQAIRFADGHPRHVFVLSIPDWGVTPFAEGRDRAKIAHEIDAFNEAHKQITLAHQCHHIYITDSMRQHVKEDGYVAGDGLHPGPKEYTVWAERLSKEVVKVIK